MAGNLSGRLDIRLLEQVKALFSLVLTSTRLRDCLATTAAIELITA